MSTKIFTALLLLALCAADAAAEERRLAVIVHPERRAELTRAELSQIYLKRRRFWDDGKPIVALNASAGTALRETFSRLVLGQSEARLVQYWNRQYFYGVLPPATLASSEGIRRYVAAERNAIGYVPEDQVDDSVRVVLHLEE